MDKSTERTDIHVQTVRVRACVCGGGGEREREIKMIMVRTHATLSIKNWKLEVHKSIEMKYKSIKEILHSVKWT